MNSIERKKERERVRERQCVCAFTCVYCLRGIVYICIG